MAYDQKLASRIEGFFDSLDIPRLQIKKMFGGVGYLLNGNMAFGIQQEKLIVRVGKEAYQEALEQPFTSHFDLTGRPMRGWVYVEPPGINKDEGLLYWIKKGIDFASGLPPK
jgi:hypothetical protein